MLFATVILLLSLISIVGLFAFKYWELRSGRIVFADARSRIDAHAINLKELMVAARLDLAKLPPELVRLGRTLIHTGALALASLARMGEREAHRLADLVSYKHRFERRETSSEFLKKVAEHKNGTEEATSSVAYAENI